MPLYLEATDIIKIQIDFPNECMPTCHICGNYMNTITIMSDCIYTERDTTLTDKDGKFIGRVRLEGGTTHIHFHHIHPNTPTKKTGYFCPLYTKRW